ncbi:MAG: class I SAM-dependent methyltransferase [Deltaproteobacteria bacterium]|nr:class I SAM-dependent methyltransferase [Deltaproteobacteria bacterium]
MKSSDYKLLDSGNGQKLEQVGPYRLVRQALQAVWQRKLPATEWRKADAEFERSSDGKGTWTKKNPLMPSQWVVGKEPRLKVQLTDFGHLGIFPEHAQTWNTLASCIAKNRLSKKPFKCLNLFAYTGVLTLLVAEAGAEVVHVDASKKSVQWASENAQVSGCAHLPIRWIVEDVRKFVAKELRRGARYQGIILDPPTFGRGAKNEVWKIEEDLSPLLKDLRKLCADDVSFVLLTCHTPGFTPLVLKNLISDIWDTKHVQFGELTLEESSGRLFPSGSYCLNLSTGSDS